MRGWLAAAVLCSASAALTAASETAVPPGMVDIAAGTYLPLYRPSELNPGQASADESGVAVAAFYLDAHLVTNEQYLTFVIDQPEWRRSRVPRLFADATYLENWAEDLSLGERAPPRAPVVGVSWFAASAYCRARGSRLPNTAEWEYAAAADEMHRQSRSTPEFTARILAWYSRPSATILPPVGSVYRNAWGVYDMHGLVWEWTRDFNNALVTGESRADTGLERKLFCGAASIGAADFDDYAGFMRYGFRSSLQGKYTIRSLGFRCAQSAI
jgi:formylglycine-generating enzyme required for sulfatase activity